MAYNFNWSLAFSYLPMFVDGLLLGLGIAALSLVVGSAIGLVAGALSLGRSRTVRWLVRAYVEVVRNVPILLWAYIVYYALPHFGISFLNNYQSFILALSVYAGAYLTEIFRSGLASIPERYADAGRAMGLTRWQRTRLVTLPLMFRIVLPSLTNSFISLFKDTSVATALAVPEITYAATYVNINTFRILEAWAIASVIYLVVGYGLAFAFRAFERRYRMVA